jgi:hypothetical protein
MKITKRGIQRRLRGFFAPHIRRQGSRFKVRSSKFKVAEAWARWGLPSAKKGCGMLPGQTQSNRIKPGWGLGVDSGQLLVAKEVGGRHPGQASQSRRIKPNQTCGEVQSSRFKVQGSKWQNYGRSGACRRRKRWAESTPVKPPNRGESNQIKPNQTEGVGFCPKIGHSGGESGGCRPVPSNQSNPVRPSPTQATRSDPASPTRSNQSDPLSWRLGL